MAGVLRKFWGEIKKAAFRITPEWLKPCVIFLYHIVQRPSNYRKELNMLKYNSAVGRKESADFTPPVFIATIATLCNLRCPNCLYVLKDADVFKGGGFIKPEDLKEIIEKHEKDIDIVWLTGGEPLLHPEFDGIVKMLKGKGLCTNVSTNGICIEEQINSLKSVDFINISVDSYDYDSFRRFRGGTQKQYNKIMRGLSLLKENNIEFMNTFLLSEENLEEIYKMIEFAHKSQPSFVSFHNINPHGSRDFTPLTTSSGKVNRIINDITSRTDYPFDVSLPVIFDTENENFKTAKCIQPWYYFCFDDRGDIAYCCHLRHERSIGNVFEGYQFNSPLMQNFRQRAIKNQYPEDCLYCQRRFIGREYGHFSSKTKEWKLL
jgi:MoaA/NifB/PqqE/SkfB family radical SAM enzyme